MVKKSPAEAGMEVAGMKAFGQLPESLKLFHVASPCCIAVAIILLMTPAALHRISFAGEDTPSFFTIGSWFVILAPAPLSQPQRRPHR
jgi:hypothetical protein